MDTQTSQPSPDLPANPFLVPFKRLEQILLRAGFARTHSNFDAAVLQLIPSTLRATEEEIARLEVVIQEVAKHYLNCRNDGVTKQAKLVRMGNLCPFATVILAVQIIRSKVLFDAEQDQKRNMAEEQANIEAVDGVLSVICPDFDARALEGEDPAVLAEECLKEVVNRTTAPVDQAGLLGLLSARFAGMAAAAKAIRERGTAPPKPELVVDNTLVVESRVTPEQIGAMMEDLRGANSATAPSEATEVAVPAEAAPAAEAPATEAIPETAPEAPVVPAPEAPKRRRFTKTEPPPNAAS